MAEVEIEHAVKSALEDGVGVNPEELRRIVAFAEREAKVRVTRRRLWRGAAPALLAATVALVVAFQSWLSVRSGRDEDAVKGAIELLCEMDGFADSDTEGFTTEELLLVWQEAPCLDVL